MSFCMSFFLLCLFYHSKATVVFDTYHNYAGLSSALDYIAEISRPIGLCKKISIGKSVEGKDLYGMFISSNENDTWKSEIKSIGQIHGDESVGREVSLRFIYYLCSWLDVLVEPRTYYLIVWVYGCYQN